jgi:hypothetical protein
LLTTQAFARHEVLMWRPFMRRWGLWPITLRVSAASRRCAKIKLLRVRVGTV